MHSPVEMNQTPKKFVHHTLVSSCNDSSNCNAISLSPWVKWISRHLLHNLMQPLLHWAILSHQWRLVLHPPDWIQLIEQQWPLAHCTGSDIIWTHLSRYNKQIIIILLKEPVVVKVLHHLHKWIYLCHSNKLWVMIVQSNRQTWLKT